MLRLSIIHSKRRKGDYTFKFLIGNISIHEADRNQRTSYTVYSCINANEQKYVKVEPNSFRP